ncbi:hypothetical protein EKPJFOCH_1616 [Methylobacterium thuringiense]|uniref:DUF302 domain-containing protein n=1 Tax=Methylobacterium thuringiense TaxID=1003091 RepID=A0ABQ4TKI0_9HYPH|nr:hypothetical protein EKPJFOCH_1616 [Methylobacterium thuringiense]
MKSQGYRNGPEVSDFALDAILVMSLDISCLAFARSRPAKIRVLLREDAEGNVAFEYDRPATTFGQFRNTEVDRVAANLDAQLRTTLATAAG